MKKPAVRLLFIFFLLVFVTFANADRFTPTGTIRFGIFPFNPINYTDKDGTAKGINPDLLREIFRDDSTHLAFVPGSWQEGLKRLQEEEIDIMMSVAYSEERAKIMDYGRESVLQLWGQVFTRLDQNSKNISDLFNKKIGVMARDISGKNFMTTVGNLGGSCQIIEYSDFDTVFQAVENGEVFAGVAPQHFGLRHAAEYDLVATSILFSPFSIYFTSKKGTNKAILDHIDAHLSLWKKDKNSVYYEIMNRWMAPVGNGQRIPTWLLSAFALVLSLALVFACFILRLNRAVKRKTRELEESESKFRDVLMNISDCIWEVNIDGIFTYCSEASRHLLGYDPEEMVGRSYLDFISQQNVDEAGRAFNQTKNSHQPYRNREVVCTHKDGRTVFLLNSAVPIIGKNGNFLGFRGVSTDITERKIAEEKRQILETKLVQAQKMETVGTLAGGIAHDFNNILAAILGYTELAMMNCPPDSPTAQLLEQTLGASNRARDLVKQILAFSRQGETSRIPLQPAHIIKEALKMLRPTLPTTIEIRKNIHQSDDTVFADPSQLSQIIINLCTNAFHAMEAKGGILEVSMDKVILDDQDPGAAQGPYIKISVVDSGSGIPPEIKNRIFDPYFTTKEVGKGTGMGLAIAHGIVKSYGGFITCSSTPGKGTVFEVFLPVLDRSETPGNEEKTVKLHGSERLIFVDDEQIIVDVTREVLENLGYTVFPFTDSGQALAVFQETPDVFDLVVTDQTMPGMTGEELAGQMLKIRPELPIILCTGYSTLITEEKALKMGIRKFLLKPVTPKEMARLIRNIFDDSMKVSTDE
ncbi:MAG: ATP-binding protein [Desulforhopalus sp.]